MSRPPECAFVDEARWPLYFYEDGRVRHELALREAIFTHGMAKSLRPRAWSLLLGVLPFSSTHHERECLARLLGERYTHMRTMWQSVLRRAKYSPDGTVSSLESREDPSDASSGHGAGDRLNTDELDVECLQCVQVVDADVPRTDSSVPDVPEEDVQALLRNVLITHVFFDPELGYWQGMNDLLVPIVETLGARDESLCFWMFAASMKRARARFVADGVLEHLRLVGEIVQYADKRLYQVCTSNDADASFMFLYRWILVDFKREFRPISELITTATTTATTSSATDTENQTQESDVCSSEPNVRRKGHPVPTTSTATEKDAGDDDATPEDDKQNIAELWDLIWCEFGSTHLQLFLAASMLLLHRQDIFAAGHTHDGILHCVQNKLPSKLVVARVAARARDLVLRAAADPLCPSIVRNLISLSALTAANPQLNRSFSATTPVVTPASTASVTSPTIGPSTPTFLLQQPRSVSVPTPNLSPFAAVASVVSNSARANIATGGMIVVKPQRSSLSVEEGQVLDDEDDFATLLNNNNANNKRSPSDNTSLPTVPLNTSAPATGSTNAYAAAVDAEQTSLSTLVFHPHTRPQAQRPSRIPMPPLPRSLSALLQLPHLALSSREMRFRTGDSGSNPFPGSSSTGPSTPVSSRPSSPISHLLLGAVASAAASAAADSPTPTSATVVSSPTHVNNHHGTEHHVLASETRTQSLASVLMRRDLASVLPSVVVEAGCGIGSNTTWLLKRGWRVIALEISEAMLTVARRTLHSKAASGLVRFAQTDLQAPWPVAPCVAHLVTMDLMLQHIAAPRTVFRQAAMALRAGGRFRLCEVHPKRLRRDQLLEERQHHDENDPHDAIVAPPPPPAHVHDVDLLAASALRQGLKLMRVRHVLDTGEELDEEPAFLVPALIVLDFVRQA